MKKVILRISGLALVATFFIAFSGFTSGEDNAAGVNKDFECSLFDGDGYLVPATDAININNNGGNITLVCKAKGVANSSGEEVVTSGFGCWVWDGNAWILTYDSYNVVSEDGNATIRCQIKKEKE